MNHTMTHCVIIWNRRVFNDHKAFRDSSDSCLRAMATEITERRVCHGDLVYHKGEMVDEVVFVMSGTEFYSLD